MLRGHKINDNTVKAIGPIIGGRRTVYRVIAVDTTRNLVRVTPLASVQVEGPRVLAVHPYNGVDMGKVPQWRRAESFGYVKGVMVDNITVSDVLAMVPQ